MLKTSSSGLERDSSDDYLVVQSSKSSSNEGSNPENPLHNIERKGSISAYHATRYYVV